MVTETQHRSLVDECREWYSLLGTYRQRISNLKNELYFFAPGKTNEDTRLGIEHFHNQFHIQLINIHDLKHEIKQHITEAERRPGFGHRIPHHTIKGKLDLLISDLDELEAAFYRFIKQ